MSILITLGARFLTDGERRYKYKTGGKKLERLLGFWTGIRDHSIYELLRGSRSSSIFSAQVLASKYHLPTKGTRTPERNVGFQSQIRESIRCT